MAVAFGSTRTEGTFRERGPGCRLVNEPDTLVRNDLVTPEARAARAFHTSVFDFTLDGNDDLPGVDFTFLRRPDGHEIGGVMGLDDAVSAWATTFEVADTDATLALVTRAASATGRRRRRPRSPRSWGW